MPLPSRSFAALLLAVVSCLGLACDSSTPTCDAGPETGVVSVWVPCSDHARGDGHVPVTLTNGTTAFAWHYHECEDEVPWPEMLQPDGTWLRLLPADFFLPISCHHVMEMAPGESMELTMSTARTTVPGTYRAVMPVAFGCIDIHQAIHVPHSCERVDFIASEPFALR